MEFIQLGSNGRKSFLTYLFVIVSLLIIFIVTGEVSLFLIVEQVNPASEIGEIADLIGVLGKNWTFMILLIPFLFGVLLFRFALPVFHRRSFMTIITSRLKIDWRRFFFSFSCWMLINFIFLGIQYFLSNKLVFQLDWGKFLTLAAISVILLPFQTFFEELMFRGYLLQGVHLFFKRKTSSILFVGILFGLLHGANPEVKQLGYGILVYYVVSGLFLTLITVLDDGIELSFGYHTANNLFGAIILTSNWQAFQTDALFLDTSKPSFGLENWLTLLIIQPVLFFLFYRKYNWDLNRLKSN